MTMYPEEILGEDDDDGTMVQSAQALREAVVGHKIVDAGYETLHIQSRWGGDYEATDFTITLDNGTKVVLVPQGDWCAYTELTKFLLHADKVDHIITGVGTTDGYATWHIYADMGDVLELTVGWSCGNPFYYGYGFHIAVKEVGQ